MTDIFNDYINAIGEIAINTASLEHVIKLYIGELISK